MFFFFFFFFFFLLLLLLPIKAVKTIEWSGIQFRFAT